MESAGGYGHRDCSDCGESISDRTLWVDDSGLLCRQCALLVRFRRMKGEGPAWAGRKGSGVGRRSLGRGRRSRGPGQGVASPREKD